MKKENKFRIWNGMEMVYDVTVGKFGVFYVNPEKGDGLNPSDTASLTQNTTKYFDNTPVMQFIGLKDKNQTDIYEGDIVGICRNNDESGFYVVEIKDIRHIPEEFYGSNFTYSFIMGDIHKNPELLKP